MDEQQKNKEIIKFYIEHLHEYRKEIHEGKYKAIEAYDKLIIQIAIATIGISVVFLEHIAGSAPYDKPFLLYLSWVFGSFSILTTLYNHLISYFSHSNELEETDEIIAKFSAMLFGLEYKTPEKKYQSVIKASFNKLIDKLNPFSGLLLLMSLSFLLTFTAVNFDKANQMTKDQNSSQPYSAKPSSRPPEPLVVKPEPSKATSKSEDK
jgi:hypothetical protein